MASESNLCGEKYEVPQLVWWWFASCDLDFREMAHKIRVLPRGSHN